MSQHIITEIDGQDSRFSRREALKLLGIGAVAGGSLGSLPEIARADSTIQKLTADDGDGGDSFGVAVAVDGDTALIGAGSDDAAADFAGAAYIFTFDATTDTWSQQQKLLASDADERDRFGTAVALDGDTALVGAFRDSNDKGAAYVFERSGGSWPATEDQKLTAVDADQNDNFGISVGLDGETATIGAPGDSEAADFAGVAYIFTREGDSFTQTQKLTASDAAEQARFGSSVTVEGGTAFVGAPDGASEVFRGLPGAAYVYERADGNWPATEDQKLTPTDTEKDDRFGASVALDGETVVIGAPSNDGMADEAGAAYVFTDETSGWNESQKLTADDADAGDHFGGEVALDGDTALIGAEDDDEKATSAGAAYVFEQSDGSWPATEDQKLTATDPGREERFGDAVALDGTTGLVGASGDDEEGTLAGAAYVFPNVTELEIASIQLRDVRVVQTVEDTVLRDSSSSDTPVSPDPPDLVAGRNTMVLFNLLGSSDLDLLPDDSTVEFDIIREFGDGTSTTDTLALSKNRVQALNSETAVDTAVFGTFDDDPPVFEATTDLDSITVSVNPDIDGDGTPEISGDAESILVGLAGDIDVLSIDRTDIGFIELRDPNGGKNYGDGDGEIKDDFDELVTEALDYIERTYPVDGLDGHAHPDQLSDSSLLNTEKDGGDRAIIEDMQSARSALEDEFPDVDFDVTVAVVPEGYPGFHLDDGFSGVHYGDKKSHPRASAVVRGDLRIDDFLEWYQHVVAQEVGHHFMPKPSYPDDLAMRVDKDKDGDVDEIDNAHARTESPVKKWSPTSAFIDSTGFDLVDGVYERTSVKRRAESFMSYNIEEFDMPSWNDAHAYQTMLTSGLEPLPPENAPSSTDSEALIVGAGRVTDAGDLVVTRTFTREGQPMPSVDDGAVALTVLDANGTVLDARSTPDSIGFDQVTRGDSRSGGVVDRIFTFAVPFPEEAAEVRAERDGTVTRLNPVERSLREAIARLPDAAFTRSATGRRGALNRKLDELDEKMAAGEYRDALNLLEKDIRDKLVKWLEEEYETSAFQPTKTELLALVDEMIARLEALVAASSS